MEKRHFIYLVSLMILLLCSILMMAISLLVKENTFRQISGYVAIGCIVITVIGVALILISEKRNKSIVFSNG